MQFLTLKQVADLLKVHPNTVRAHAIRGTIPAAKVGRGWRFLEEDLVAWIRGRYPRGYSNASAGGPHRADGKPARPARTDVADTQLGAERALDALLAKPIRKRLQRRE